MSLVARKTLIRVRRRFWTEVIRRTSGSVPRGQSRTSGSEMILERPRPERGGVVGVWLRRAFGSPNVSLRLRVLAESCQRHRRSLASSHTLPTIAVSDGAWPCSLSLGLDSFPLGTRFAGLYFGRDHLFHLTADTCQMLTKSFIGLE